MSFVISSTLFEMSIDEMKHGSVRKLSSQGKFLIIVTNRNQYAVQLKNDKD
jgi:hypothetical protein